MARVWSLQDLCPNEYTVCELLDEISAEILKEASFVTESCHQMAIEKEASEALAWLKSSKGVEDWYTSLSRYGSYHGEAQGIFIFLLDAVKKQTGIVCRNNGCFIAANYVVCSRSCQIIHARVPAVADARSCHLAAPPDTHVH